MPTVPAAGYQTGPEAPPAVPLTVPVDDFLRIPNATPEAFGAGVGTALSRAGAVGEQAGSELAQAAISRQDFFNKVASDGANNEYMKEAHKLFYGDPDAGVDPVTGKALKPGFFALKGQDAIDAGPPNDALDKLQRDIAARLPNDRARLEFSTETRHLRSYQDGEISRHWDEQLKTAGSELQISLADQADRDAAHYFNDPTRLGEIIERNRDAAVKHAQIANGMNASPAIIADAVAKADARTYNNAIRGAFAQGDLYAADRLKKEALARGVFTGKDAEEVEKLIAPRLDQQIGKDAGRAGFTSGAPGGGAARATGLVPYTPSSDMLSGTGLSADQYETFRSHVAARESGSYAQQPNAGGYMGRYQMGSSEIKDTANRLGVPVPTQQQFLSDPALQERFFENYTLDHHNSLMAQSEQYRNAPPTEKAAILMGAHLGGVQGVQDYLAGKSNPADSNGTRVGDYVTSMRTAMAGGAAPGSTQPAATPGAPGAIEVRGDSLGVGLKGRLGAGGNAVGGASPTAIFDDIKKEPESHWQGKTVVLPSGSNGNQMPVVEDTIKYLQDHGANVIAVGYGPKFPEKNAQLAEIAGRLKVPVIAAEDVSPSEGVHPSPRGYQSMADKIRAAAGGAPGKPQTVAEGQVIYGPNGQQLKNVGGKLVDVTPRAPPPEM